jgi:Acetyltransferase (GNAT) domain
MHIHRRNSPSLTTSSSTSRWRRTASRIASSSIRRSSDRSRSRSPSRIPSALVRGRRRSRNAGRPGAGATRRPRPEPASVERESRRKDRLAPRPAPATVDRCRRFSRPNASGCVTTTVTCPTCRRCTPSSPMRTTCGSTRIRSGGGEPRVDRAAAGAVRPARVQPVGRGGSRDGRVPRQRRPDATEVDGVEEIELGWSVTPTRSGQGIATEAGLACRDWCFAHLEVDHLISLVRPENVPSRACGGEHRHACLEGDGPRRDAPPRLPDRPRRGRPAKPPVSVRPTPGPTAPRWSLAP